LACEFEIAKGCDLIVLPETWRGQNDESKETLNGPTIAALSRVAKKYKTYMVSPIDRLEDGRRGRAGTISTT